LAHQAGGEDAETLRESEARLKAIFDQASAGIAQTDLDGRFISVNDRYCEIVGRSREELMSLRMQDITHPQDLPGNLPLFAAAARDAEAFEIEKRYLRADGSTVWVRNSVTGMRNADGAVQSILAVSIDLTERREAEAVLHESEARFRNMADHAPVMMWVTEPDGNCSYLNRAWYEFTGQSREEAEGLGWLDATHPDDKAEAERIFLEANAKAEAFRLEYRLRRADGVYRWAIDAASPRFGPDGGFLGYVGSVIDIDERRVAEDRLRFLAQLDEALRQSRDAPAAMAAAAELLAQRLDATRCAYAAVDADNDGFVIHDDYTAPGVMSSAGTYRLDLFGPRAAIDLRAGRTLVVNNVAAELAPGEGREMFHAIGIDAIICCPLIKSDRLVAMMAVHQDRAREWTEHEIALVETVVERCWAHVERVGAEARLRESEERLRLAVDNAEIGFWDVNVLEDMLIWPARTKAMFGISPDVPVTMEDFYQGLHPDDREATSEAYAAAADPTRRELYDVEYRTIGKEDGVIRWVAAKGRGLFAGDGPDARCLRVIGTAVEITARKQAEETLRDLNETLERRVADEVAERTRAEEALRQAQKMEAMGQLTGGVAHDFNNLLTPIVASLDILQRKGIGGDREQRLIAGAVQSAERARTLVQRLLAFARRQPLQPIAVDIAALVGGMGELVSSTIGPQIEVVVEAPGDLPSAQADPNQIEMALLNLAVNARDAMPEGGTLRITASAERLDEPRGELCAGDYVRLSVADTGMGMDKAVLARAVEPFFSTKGVGRGTGLGLSMVHGLASQLGGALIIKSRPELGTNVELWLPVSETPAEAAKPVVPAEAATRTGVALLVDDEELVRATTADMLSDLGYEVVEADSAEKALELVRQGLTPSVVITDHLMPGMNGADLARQIRVERPAARVLIVSGYAEVEGVAADIPRLNKPFRSEDLTASLASLG
jgi:PAS domain S-box-containing protein